MKRIRQKLLRGNCIALVLLFFTALSANAQTTVQVKGTVKDSKGEPLPGVSVKLKSTVIGASTNVDGVYTLNLPSAAGTLVFSSLGYLTKEVVLGTNRTIDVVLDNDTKALEEVVVVGYGTQQKVSVTGAISTVKAEDLVRTPAVAATNALVGKIPGITSRSTDSRPGNGTNLQIRNLGTPLYVIDGVPYSTNDSQSAFGFNNNNSGANVFNNLGLEDIESVTVLKDASAAVYGLRASNGVVLVTTKKGKKETSTINISSYYGMQNFTRYPRPANAGEYVRAQLEADQNKTLSAANPALLYSPADLAKWEDGTEKGYKSYDYFDAVTRPNVPQYYLSANASGGTQRSTYHFSVSHINQDALIKDFTYDRTNLQANLTASLAKGLQIGTQLTGRLTKIHNVGVPGLDDYFNPLLSISSMWPTEPLYANDNPLYINQGHSVNVNPATYKDEVTGYINEVFRNFNMNLNATYDFPFGLTAKGVMSYNYTNEDFDGFEYTYDAYTYLPATDTYRLESGNQNPWREKHKRNIFGNFAQFQLNYQKTIGSHSVSAVAAYERSDQENEYLAIHSIPPNNYIPIMAFANQDVLQDTWAVEARAGYVGSVNYAFKQKYLLRVLGRYDGSYLYRADKRWGFFPGIETGWRISEESFVKAKFSFLNELKLRVSYGETGSESNINAFDYLAGYNFNNGNSVFDGNYVIGLAPRGLPITNLSWVKNRTINLGIDFTLFNKFTGQFDVFRRRRTGLPASKYDVLLPSEAGYSLPLENLNSDEQRGIEGLLSYEGRVGKFDYSISGNATLSRSMNLQQYKPRFGNSWDEYRNSAINRWAGINIGYEIIGRFQSQQEIDNYKINNDGQGNRTQLPGDFMYNDANGDGHITTEDQRPIGYATGSAQPYMSFGTSMSVGYKNFNLAADFSGSTMQTFVRNVELKIPFQNSGNSPKYMLTDRWRREDPYDLNSKWIPGTYPATRRSEPNHANFRNNSFWYTNVTYYRLRNLELGYTFPQKLVKKVGMSKLRVYANGSNLFSFDSVKDYQIDPEISSSGGLIYPQQRLYNFGFNLTL